MLKLNWICADHFNPAIWDKYAQPIVLNKSPIDAEKEFERIEAENEAKRLAVLSKSERKLEQMRVVTEEKKKKKEQVVEKEIIEEVKKKAKKETNDKTKMEKENVSTSTTVKSFLPMIAAAMQKAREREQANELEEEKTKEAPQLDQQRVKIRVKKEYSSQNVRRSERERLPPADEPSSQMASFVEAITEEREENGSREVLIKWSTIDGATWEPIEDVKAIAPRAWREWLLGKRKREEKAARKQMCIKSD